MNRLAWISMIMAGWLFAGHAGAQDINAWEPMPYNVWTALQARGNAGDGEAAFQIYNLYLDRDDHLAAYPWLEKAADDSWPEALLWSFLIYDGDESSGYKNKDYVKALGRLKQLEAIGWEKGFVGSNLGDYYRYCRGVERDYATAFAYFAPCADPAVGTIPDVFCQLSLSDMYADGLGTEKNELLAYVWYALGAEQWRRILSTPEAGYRPLTRAMVKRLYLLKSRLDSAQLTDALARIAAFRCRFPAYDVIPPSPPEPPPPLGMPIRDPIALPETRP